MSVVHNGVLVHENAEVTGPTRAARFESETEEGPAGPLQLQGDHGPVAYRNLRIRPVRLDEGRARGRASGEHGRRMITWGALRPPVLSCLP